LRQEFIFEPQWIAPEALRTLDSEIQDFRVCDVYSFGMVLFEIITRQLPFEGLHAMQVGIRVFFFFFFLANCLFSCDFMQICLENLRPTIPEFVPRHLTQLLTLCWQEESARRPKMSQILAILEKL